MTPEERLGGVLGAVPEAEQSEAADEQDGGQQGAGQQGAGGRRRISALRVLALLAGVGVAAALVVDPRDGGADAAAPAVQDFAPYVDVTATPTHAFEDRTVSGGAGAVLAFVVSDPGQDCRPSWGGAYTLEEAAVALDLDRRVARLQQLGGDPVVSFGGAANSELAIGCTDVDRLTAAYRSVVTRYDVDTIDLDVEGSAASDPAVSARRAEAIREVVAAEAADGRDLEVWLTLPVATTGLVAEGSAVLDAMLDEGAPVSGVNAMVMNYGTPADGRTMGEQAEAALTALHAQLRAAYAAAGTELSDAEVWSRIAATPMIGQNDVPGEVFTLDDARRLVAFADAQGLRRLSMWSANRDRDCGPNYPDPLVVSDECSGVAQQTGEFAAILGEHAAGAAPEPAEPSAAASPDRASPPEKPADDPARSPYPVWDARTAYLQGTKVVWHRNVYQAKWFSEGEQPDAPVEGPWATPWTLLGPVLPGERPAATPTLPAGTHPKWEPGGIYEAGRKVLHHGVGYQAKWWTQGDAPHAEYRTPWDNPWRLLD